MSIKSKCIANLISSLDNLKSIEKFSGRAGIIRKIKQDIIFLGKYQVEDGICRLISKEVERILRKWGCFGG